jgi:hypothetical protein
MSPSRHSTNAMMAVATCPVDDSLDTARKMTSIVVSGFAHCSTRFESRQRAHQLVSAAKPVATNRASCTKPS